MFSYQNLLYGSLKRPATLAVLTGAVCCLTAVAQPGQNPQGRIPGRFLVQHRAGADAAKDDNFLRESKARVVKRIERLRISVVEVPEPAAEQLARKLHESGRFTFVEPDFTARGAILSNDPSAGSQWHLSKIAVQSAWNISTGSTSVPIAIVDSGVDGSHPDLSGKIVAGWNFLGSNSDTSDVLGHGTAVAGAAAASTDNGIGVAGVAWKNPIMPLVVLNASDYAAYSDVANAIVYAADRGVRIINVSICGTSASSTLQNAVDYAWNKGALVFAAAGNKATSALTYPAACARAIAVSSTETNDTFSSFSNYGSWIDVSAPGNYILTTKKGGTYSQWYGTSFASPIAAGVAALALSVRPSIDKDTLLGILQQNSDDLGTPGFDNNFGWGRVNAYRAVQAAAAVSSDLAAPLVSIASPAPSSIVAGIVSITGTATDNVGVAGCTLYVDNSEVSRQGQSFTFAWDSRTVANGTHTLAAACSDAAANVGQSSVTISVSNPIVVDSTAPTVAITSPAAGSRVSGQVKISVAATDDVGLSQVSIYIDNVQVYTSTSSCSYTWNTRKAKSGTHVITARAWDQAGNIASTSINVIR